MVDTVISKNHVSNRLTEEHWKHIVSQHGELAEFRQWVLQTPAEPDRILAGGTGEMLAVREIEASKWLVVVYRELSDDGFVITAFWTRRSRALDKRKVLWSR